MKTRSQLTIFKFEEEIGQSQREKDDIARQSKRWQSTVEGAACEIARLQDRGDLFQKLRICHKSEKEALREEIKSINSLLMQYGIDSGVNARDLEDTGDGQSNTQRDQTSRQSLLSLFEKQLRRLYRKNLDLEDQISLCKKSIFNAHARIKEVEKQNDKLQTTLTEKKSVLEKKLSRSSK
ncbi:hypothetical protein CISG_08382 [Coccidioides immitis RMSCC 3703]|uniref:Uncharacterized protein n=2 Tax=Coccidioides immitis TaxID=5501 RepID=A0A0J8R630_COCIT|nr:hypothetical protein CIRG_02980 [Coccidioides immitis RMSCC 2394]KMU80276.1 hypothetical protein CISG_08382 [Coccidioides immitis RMSCC 3703]